jgi:hypothetical protein
MAVSENGAEVSLSRSVSASWPRNFGSPFSSSCGETAGHFLAVIFARADERMSLLFAVMNS